jgi:hypothetical protein
VKDVYFDADHWVVRYLVVDTGTWLPGRRVLLSPVCVQDVNWDDRRIVVELTKQQIKDSPDVAADKPVSRQIEEQLAGHYGWPTYWGAPYPGRVSSTSAARQQVPDPVVPETDSNLRSMKEVSGYHIDASDGSIGHVDDLIISEDDWTIRYMILDTKNWLPGRRVLVPPILIESINWKDSTVSVELTREQVKSSPEYETKEPVTRAYEARLYDHYGWPAYWI